MGDHHEYDDEPDVAPVPLARRLTREGGRRRKVTLRHEIESYNHIRDAMPRRFVGAFISCKSRASRRRRHWLRSIWSFTRRSQVSSTKKMLYRFYAFYNSHQLLYRVALMPLAARRSQKADATKCRQEMESRWPAAICHYRRVRQERAAHTECLSPLPPARQWRTLRPRLYRLAALSQPGRHRGAEMMASSPQTMAEQVSAYMYAPRAEMTRPPPIGGHGHRRRLLGQQARSTRAAISRYFFTRGWPFELLLLVSNAIDKANAEAARRF